ncbi:uncharacterized protein LOC110987233 isoform X2 [Acanthaster planci]|uniref:Uncharacterized protein LOC110987233 isoform X2 n=1 Tax=Acanthaster planci TaxID=133434 RepID=A0A8B7ZPY9_ACAPL|nr:uncharacterized protein LOC110987233 isoform X2 [Acanthaster planci]
MVLKYKCGWYPEIEITGKRDYALAEVKMMQFAEVASLKLFCLQQISELVARNHIHLCSLEAFPSRLLRDLAPVLSIDDLARLHRILCGKGIDVQQYWLKFYRQAFQEDRLARQCSCHDLSLANVDWRQRFLDKRCEQELQKLGPSPSEGIEEQDTLSLKILDILGNPLSTHGPLDDFFPSLLVLHSDLLPYVQRNEEIMKILQKSLRELVLTDYLPKYESILQQFLEFLIHQGVLRKFTLKHPLCEAAAELFKIFKVCSGVLGEIVESGGGHVAVPCCREECCDPLSSHSESISTEEAPCVMPQLCQIPQGEAVGSQEDPCSTRAQSNTVNLDISCPHASSHQETNAVKSVPRPVYDRLCCCCCGLFTGALTPESDLDGQSAQDASLFSHIDPHSHRCHRTADHCIQHLVFYDCFFKNQSDHTQMLETLFSIWPGLRELEFVNASKTGGTWENTCIKVLSRLIKGQRPTPSLQRLRIQGSFFDEFSFVCWLSDLLIRSEFKTLELESTNFRFLLRDTDSGRFLQFGRRRLPKDVFAHMNVVDIKYHQLVSPHYLECALLQPDCTITVLNLEYCQLRTPKVDSLFIHAKESKCLRELSVVRNGYCPHMSHYTPAGYSGLAQLMQSGHLTKLNLGGCGFALTGWAHATDFVEALRLNCSLHQLLLAANHLTDECLHLLATAFVNSLPEINSQASNLCLDISFNSEITHDGMDEFSQAFLASTKQGRRSSHLCHLTLTKEEGENNPGVHWELAELMKLTVNHEASLDWPLASDRGHISDYRGWMMKHQSQISGSQL